ncbi:RND efflux system, outer membrane lipoprotein, NodT family [Arcobacter nitrofigilis DSM 7299]|uniref:RND efflux system, outer membrane lipoprotein, NodT family n=1 Tax=Arcobacter nitrofigilis (strain ATCC 33309 / DSM 7299 / CCUG 15893 / LMG 7604 / NCTC 12251 / CI) TaxID=572480 RepID=D5V0X2_ARCNC|nr:efflux transporter outer membrane subunit [Arcobacter nitrofigilis]ADG93934.1 RND efflux system, outer membrane lipoprotein, NodT family [Arcobacter nitrofigilis DSM 7299]
MNDKNTNLLSKYLKTIMTITTLSIMINGCALLPGEKELIKPNTISKYKSKESFDNKIKTQWPKESWWKVYGDKQLNELISEALKDSPNMISAMARLNEADAYTQVTKSTNLPQISANAQVTKEKRSYNYITPRSVTPKGWNDYGQATLNFSWELDFWGKNRATIAASISNVEAMKAELAQTRLTLSSAIASNYAQLARLYANMDELKEYLIVQNKLLTLLNQRYENGLENKSTVDDAKSLLANAQGDVLSLDEQISLQKNKIAALMGAGPDRGLKITRPTIDFYKIKFGLPDDLAVNLLGRRPDIMAARMQVESKEYLIKEKKAEFYPNINLSAFIGLQSLGLNLLHEKDSYMGSVGPAISLPIFSAGRLKGDLRRNKSIYEQAVANYNQTITQALKEVADAGTSQKSLAKQIFRSLEALNSSKEAYEIKTKRYEGGLSNYLEVLYSQENLINAKRNFINQKSRALTLDIALKYALGGGYNQKLPMNEKGNNNGK